MPESFRNRHVRDREAYTSKPTIRPMGVGLELSARHKDGTQFAVEISLSAATGDGGVSVIAVIRDVRERNRLRAFGHQALRAMEAERKRIALELHDDLNQKLSQEREFPRGPPDEAVPGRPRIVNDEPSTLYTRAQPR